MEELVLDVTRVISVSLDQLQQDLQTLFVQRVPIAVRPAPQTLMKLLLQLIHAQLVLLVKLKEHHKLQLAAHVLQESIVPRDLGERCYVRLVLTALDPLNPITSIYVMPENILVEILQQTHKYVWIAPNTTTVQKAHNNQSNALPVATAQ
jgi:hypothetical protein